MKFERLADGLKMLMSIGFRCWRQDAREVRMLVLSRKPLQSITIGSDIKITVLKVDRNQVRIGIEAPPDVTILRDELIGLDDPIARGTVGFSAARV